MGGADFGELISVSGFVAALYVAGWVCQKLGLEPLLGEVAVGVLLGPEMANLLKHDHMEFFKLLGNIGVTLMIFESGMHLHMEKLNLVVVRSAIVAVLGTVLPIGGGLLFVYLAYGTSSSSTAVGAGLPRNDSMTSTLTLKCQGTGCLEDHSQFLYPDGFSLGCALAPTSVGIALKLLTEAKQLDSLFGQTIVTGAFIDDFITIITHLVLINLAEKGAGADVIILPVVYSLAFLIVGGVLAFKVFPGFIHKLVELLPFQDGGSSFHPVHQILLVMMFGVLGLYGYLSSLIGSHLLGTFIAGISFSVVPRSQQVWTRQMKRIAKWLGRFFFGATVAFSIPIDDMMTAESFYLGMICAIGPCILSKLLCGLAAEDPYRWVVGTAMVGRGEFAYLVAGTAYTADYETGYPPYGKMMSNKVYSICMWALLLATLVAPFGFKFFLGKMSERRAEERILSGQSSIFSFRLKVKGQYVPFIVHDVLSALKEMGLVADNSNVETDGTVFIMTTTVTTKTETPNDDLDDEAFESIRHHIFEVLNDEDGQVMMVPIVMKKAVQIGEFKLLGENGEINLKNAVATNAGGDNPSAMQRPEGSLKKNLDTRWTDRNQQPLVIHLAKPEKVVGYTFVTARDLSDNASEPISWRLEGTSQVDSENWNVIHEIDSYPTPADRNTELPLFRLDAPRDLTAIKFIPLKLPEAHENLHDTSHVTGHRFRPGVHYTKDFEDESHFIAVKVMGDHHMEFIVQIFNILQMLKLDIHKAKMYHVFSAGSRDPVSITMLYCRDLLHPGRPSHSRLADIRTKLSGQFEANGIKGKAMVKSLRSENAPAIYGFTPEVSEGEHVGEFVFVYKYPRVNKTQVWCPLTAVFAWMHEAMHFDIINLAMDRDPQSERDHVTIFVKDPEFNHHTQDNVVKQLIDIFKDKGIPAHVSAHLHEWHVDQDRVVTVLGDEGASFKRITEGAKGASVLSFQGESVGLRKSSFGSQQFSSQVFDEPNRTSLVVETLEMLRRKINNDVDQAVASLARPPLIEPNSPYG